MALGAGTHWHTLPTGADTNGGSFDPGTTLTVTDLAATVATSTAPVVTSATYSFVAGDVDHWLFIKSGTNWTPGWYKIASVSLGAATLSAAIGAATLYSTTASTNNTLSTAAGCATVASPTGGTCSIDYSRHHATPIRTATEGTNNATTAFTDASGAVFTQMMTGNTLYVASGTNATVGFYKIAAFVSTSEVTLDRTCTTGASADIAYKIGGSCASPGMFEGSVVAGNVVWYAGLTDPTANPYLLSNTSNVSGGRITIGVVAEHRGYSVIPGDITAIGSSLRPILKADANSVVCITVSAGAIMRDMVLDGAKATRTGTVGASSTGAGPFYNVTFQNCASHGSNCSASHHSFCRATANGGSGFATGRGFTNCVADNNTSAGFAAIGGEASISYCVAHSNGGDGFTVPFSGTTNFCLSANNGGDGFETSSGRGHVYSNCFAYGNTGTGFRNSSSPMVPCPLLNCAVGSNGSTTVGMFGEATLITLSGDPFTNSASDDYTLNTASAAAMQLVGQAQTSIAGVSGGVADVGHFQVNYGGDTPDGAGSIGGGASIQRMSLS